MYNLLKNKRLILTLPLFLAASLLLPVYIVPLGHASPGTGLVCITTSTSATSCPATAPTIGPLTAGTVFTVGVFIQGSDAMGGLDIYVRSHPAFVNPTGAALGNLIASPSLTSICINGSATVGSCTVNTANGPGVVEVTTIESSGSNECGCISPCSGMAFTITYQVVGTGPDTLLSYPTAAGCSASSVSSPPNTCVEVADAAGTVLSENIQGATVSAPVVAQTGKVCAIYPSTKTNCPISIEQIGPVTVGSNIIVGVFVDGSQPTGGFIIFVSVNTTYLNPLNVSLGSLITSPSFTNICINGIPQTGSPGPCDVIKDNMQGVVEVSTIESSGLNDAGTGLAFTITAQVLGKRPMTPIVLGPVPDQNHKNFCTPSSVGTAEKCVFVDDNHGTVLPQNAEDVNVTQTVIIHSTGTSLSCTPNPTVVGTATHCTPTVTDTGPASGATSPIGTVTLFTDSSGNFGSDTCTLSASGPIQSTCSAVSYTPSHVDTGTHGIGATYSGDPGVHMGSSSPALFLTVSKATPSVSTGVINDQTGVSPPAAGVPVGTSLHDVAVLNGGFPVTGVSGTVTYTLYPNGKCTAGTGTVISIRTVSASNNVAGSDSVTPANTGGTALPYAFNAVYSGDSDNNVVTSACEQFTVLPAPQFVAGKLHWTHHLSLAKSSNTQSWTAIVSNSFTTSVNVVVRIQGFSATNPFLAFDVTCGVTCVTTDSGGVNSTPGLTPVSVPAGTSSLSFSFNQAISPSFVNNKFSFTATLYWTLGIVYTPSSTKSGAFAVVS